MQKDDLDSPIYSTTVFFFFFYRYCLLIYVENPVSLNQDDIFFIIFFCVFLPCHLSVYTEAVSRGRGAGERGSYSLGRDLDS